VNCVHFIHFVCFKNVPKMLRPVFVLLLLAVASRAQFGFLGNLINRFTRPGGNGLANIFRPQGIDNLFPDDCGRLDSGVGALCFGDAVLCRQRECWKWRERFTDDRVSSRDEPVGDAAVPGEELLLQLAGLRPPSGAEPEVGLVQRQKLLQVCSITTLSLFQSNTQCCH
jgi:hypothetical protein